MASESFIGTTYDSSNGSTSTATVSSLISTRVTPKLKSLKRPRSPASWSLLRSAGHATRIRNHHLPKIILWSERWALAITTERHQRNDLNIAEKDPLVPVTSTNDHLRTLTPGISLLTRLPSLKTPAGLPLRTKGTGRGTESLCH